MKKKLKKKKVSKTKDRIIVINTKPRETWYKQEGWDHGGINE